jgi:DNA-binding MarR family transcriptional regulator
MKISANGLANLLDHVSRLSFNEGFSHGLNPAQWQCLRYFSRATDAGRTLSAFAASQGTTMGTASRTVAALTKKGYLEKINNPRDRRSSLISLTTQGDELIEQDPLNFLASSIATLETDEQRNLAGCLEHILMNMSRANGG